MLFFSSIPRNAQRVAASLIVYPRLTMSRITVVCGSLTRISSGYFFLAGLSGLKDVGGCFSSRFASHAGSHRRCAVAVDCVAELSDSLRVDDEGLAGTSKGWLTAEGGELSPRAA